MADYIDLSLGINTLSEWRVNQHQALVSKRCQRFFPWGTSRPKPTDKCGGKLWPGHHVLIEHSESEIEST